MGSAAAGVRWKGEIKLVDEDTNEIDGGSFLSRLDLARSTPSWLVSLVIHLFILIVLAVVTTPVGRELGRVLLTIGQADGVEDGELTEFEIDQNVEIMSDVDLSESESLVDVAVPTLADVGMDFSANSLSPVPVEVGLGDPVIPASPMVGGRSGSMKKTLLMLYGGTPITESAVSMGLKWLARNQNKDGSWSLRGPYDDGGNSENKPAATAMALLAFLGAGNTHTSGEYFEVVEKGARWLVKQQDRDGYFARDARDHQRAYAQAQCSIAICELYAMTKDSWLRGPAQAAIHCAEEWQADDGGWRYFPKDRGDTSVTGWYVMALQSGLSGGLEVNRAVLYKVSEFLDSVEAYEGAGYSYQARGAPSQAMTAEGLLCRQYLGWPHNEPALLRGVDALSTDYLFKIGDVDFYYWYYATQVLHHFGGEPWNRWNREMRVKLPEIQVRTGREAGSWAPQSDDWGSSGGRLYTTCMAIYCLEVYYRHMPLYKANVDEEAVAGVSAPDDDKNFDD